MRTGRIELPFVPFHCPQFLFILFLFSVSVSVSISVVSVSVSVSVSWFVVHDFCFDASLSSVRYILGPYNIRPYIMRL